MAWPFGILGSPFLSSRAQNLAFIKEGWNLSKARQECPGPISYKKVLFFFCALSSPCSFSFTRVEFIYNIFSIFIAFHVRVKNWLSPRKSSVSFFNPFLGSSETTSCKEIEFSSLRSLFRELRNPEIHPTSISKSSNEVSHCKKKCLDAFLCANKVLFLRFRG